MQKQLVTFPAADTPRVLNVFDVKGVAIYAHSVPPGETEHLVKVVGFPASFGLLDEVTGAELSSGLSTEVVPVVNLAPKAVEQVTAPQPPVAVTPPAHRWQPQQAPAPPATPQV